jgi:hypothetical protein
MKKKKHHKKEKKQKNQKNPKKKILKCPNTKENGTRIFLENSDL